MSVIDVPGASPCVTVARAADFIVPEDVQIPASTRAIARGAIPKLLLAFAAALVVGFVGLGRVAGDMVISGNQDDASVTTEVARDDKGWIIPQSIPGLLISEDTGIDSRAADRIADLTARREQLLATTPEEDLVITLPALPGDDSSPQPIDSEDPDPERLHPSSIPAEYRNR